MTDLLSIGTSATQLYRQALATVSNNIANMTSEGYSRQEIVSVENTPSQQGVYYLGTGATVETVTRAYDAFAEENLRSSASELNFQQPTIQYANRIVDVMGSETAGLSGALDKFFAGANELTTNPSSTVLRTRFLASADFLASRIASISDQLDTIGTESAADIDNGIKRVNNISEQLALINTKLQGKLTEAGQPPALLDGRDLLLRELAGLLKIEVTIATSGIADVRLAGGGEGASLVKGQNASVLRAEHGSMAAASSILTLEVKGGSANGKQYQLPGIQGGHVGGLLDFKNNLLQKAVEDLDLFADTLIVEVNNLHRSGIDLNGNLGGDLFRSDPRVEVQSLTEGTTTNLSVKVVNKQAIADSPIKLTWSKQNNGFIVEDMGEKRFFAVDQTGSADLYGLQIRNASDLVDGSILQITVTDRPAKYISMVIDNEHELAAASRLTAKASASNISPALVQVEYANSKTRSSVVPSGVFDLSLAADRNFDAAVSFNSDRPWAQIPAGTKDFSVMLQPDVSSSAQLQLVTANGMQVLGGTLSDTQALLSNQFFDSSAVFSDAAMQAHTTSGSYRDLNLVYGYRAETAVATPGSKVTVNSGSIPLQTNNGNVDKVIIADGDIRLNDIALNELAIPAGAALSALDVAAWLNQQADATGVTASATNVLKIDAATLAFGSSLIINGVTVTGAETALNSTALVERIKAVSSSTHIDAYIDVDGNINLLNRADHEGEAIDVSSSDLDGQNTLGISSKSYAGQLVLTAQTRLQFDLVTADGHGGKPADLAALGLPTGLYFSGIVPEDMAILVTGSEPGSEAITARTGGLIEKNNQPITLEPAFTVSFIDEETYTISEVASGSIIAKRRYDHLVGIPYGNITVRFDQSPLAGDQFLIEPASANSGNNGTIAALANLQQKDVFAGGNTLSGGYIKILNDVGTKSFAATIAKDALEVVYQQAVESRDSKVGVSLDQEAASLIRFQQAFQAAAQVIQTSSKLFDTILSSSR